MLKSVSIDQAAVTRKSCENRAPFGFLSSFKLKNFKATSKSQIERANAHFDVLKLQVQSSFDSIKLSTIFGTWKKSYYAKFVLVESISTSTNLPSKSPTSTVWYTNPHCIVQ